MPIPPIGSSVEATYIVAETDTAHRWGNPNVFVLATPKLLHWIEDTIAQIWNGYRDTATEALLGSEFHFKHLAPSLIGTAVSVRAEITEVHHRRICYRFEAWDEAGPICEGHSENFLMPMEKFQQRLTDRRVKLTGLSQA